jgi:predicted nucleic acid-binding protein
LDTCNSDFLFLDTNVLITHANGDSGGARNDVARILAEAASEQPKKKLWVSSVFFAELRPSVLRPGGLFRSVNDLARYVRGIATIITPTPDTMLRASRLRDIHWLRPPSERQRDEKPRCLTLGDAIHLAAALWVKEATHVSALEFVTFDNGGNDTSETEPGTKSAPLLRLQNYSHDLDGNADAQAVLSLRRVRPALPQPDLL